MPINDFKAIATFAKAVELGNRQRSPKASRPWPPARPSQLEQYLGVRSCPGRRAASPLPKRVNVS